ncbi:MAG: hypothetical protein C0415_00765 [Thermodesulfovibrio sp.]|nr:hypothetical protein [Thermodesulfovibrio sp.]
MKVLIIGVSGYIGSNLYRILSNHHNISGTYCTRHFIPLSSNDTVIHLDVRDGNEVNRVILSLSPEIIYYFSFSQEDIFGTTVLGIKNVIAAVEKASIQSKIVFLSTDNIFDGRKGMYTETDMPSPINDYGQAKYKAEKLVLNAGGMVVRTSLVYGFSPLDCRTEKLIWELNHLEKTSPYFIDEFRCPIIVDDLCNALIEIPHIQGLQIIHVAGPERYSRYEFARMIARTFCMNEEKIAFSSSNIINRPKDVSLDISLAKKLLKTKLKTFEQTLSSRRFDFHVDREKCSSSV